jgi:hypothetical protein
MKKLLVISFLLACDSATQPAQPEPPVTSEAAAALPVPPTRTVGYRNPFGNALQADNLMVDGDFELTGRTDQAPWIVFNQSQQVLNYDTGGRCRSGIRCAVIGTGDSLVGYMSSPALDSMSVRVYIQTDSGRCADATVVTVDLATNDTGNSIAAPAAPAGDGWCVFEGTAANLAFGQPVLLIMLAGNATAKLVHVDEATVLPASEAPIDGIKLTTRAPNDVIARANEVAAWLRAHRKLGRSTSPGPKHRIY